MLAWIAAALFLVVPAPGDAPSKSANPRYLPGRGVADDAGKLGYWPAKAGGVEAVDLQTGKAVWHVQEAELPLLVVKDRVFAQASVPGQPNQIRIVVLDAFTGKKQLATKPYQLPEWASIMTAHGRSFQAAMQVVEGDALLHWQARAWYAGGAAPPPEVEKAARKNAAGLVRLNFETGVLAAVKGKSDLKLKGPSEVPTMKLGGTTIAIEEMPGDNPNNPAQQRRIVKALNAQGQVIWQREIAAPVALIPLP